MAANGSGRGILFDAQGEKSGVDIIIPSPAGSPAGTTSTPNEVVSNTTSDFVITVKSRSAPATLTLLDRGRHHRRLELQAEPGPRRDRGRPVRQRVRVHGARATRVQ